MKADLSVDFSSFPLMAVILTRGDHCQVGILLTIMIRKVMVIIIINYHLHFDIGQEQPPHFLMDTL